MSHEELVVTPDAGTAVCDLAVGEVLLSRSCCGSSLRRRAPTPKSLVATSLSFFASGSELPEAG
jgi:hypothetical protein